MGLFFAAPFYWEPHLERKESLRVEPSTAHFASARSRQSSDLPPTSESRDSCDSESGFKSMFSAGRGSPSLPNKGPPLAAVDCLP